MSLSDLKAEIRQNHQVKADYFKMELICPGIAIDALPGQFVMIRTSDKNGPLLRRPFSIHDLIWEGDTPMGVALLYRVVGPGTAILSKAKPGENLQVLGPLGKGFQTKANLDSVCLVAGGIGVAPLVFLARSLAGAGGGLCLIGGRTREDVLCGEIFESLGMDVRVATDDGSLGTRGLVTGLLHELIQSGKARNVFTCGPEPMLKVVADMCLDADIPCQVSLETIMACGMGACLGCAISGPGRKILHVCKDGPVMDARIL